MSCNILGELSFIALKTGVTEPLLMIGTYFGHFGDICWPFLCFLLIVYWFVFEFLIELQPKRNFLWNLLKVCPNQIFMASAAPLNYHLPSPSFDELMTSSNCFLDPSSSARQISAMYFNVLVCKFHYISTNLYVNYIFSHYYMSDLALPFLSISFLYAYSM